MARHRGPVLVDTNVILESFRIGAWRALSGGYAVETVEDCVTETQTGFQRRHPSEQIEVVELRDSLAAVHDVTNEELAKLAILAPEIALDTGERSLWAHALSRNDDWVLCGPDTASLRFGVHLEYRDRLVALERLLEEVGYRLKEPLKTAYTTKWSERTLGELVLSEKARNA